MSKPLTCEQKALAERHLPMVHHLLRKYRKKWRLLDFDDYRGAAYLALTKAAGAFDPSRGYEFSALLGRCLLSEWSKLAGGAHYIQIPQQYEEHRKNPRTGFPEARAWAKSVKREGNTNSEGGCRLSGIVASPTNDSWAYEITSMLPENHRRIAEDVLIRGKSHHSVMKSLGLGSSRYQTTLKQTKKILADMIADGKLST